MSSIGRLLNIASAFCLMCGHGCNHIALFGAISPPDHIDLKWEMG